MKPYALVLACLCLCALTATAAAQPGMTPPAPQPGPSPSPYLPPSATQPAAPMSDVPPQATRKVRYGLHVFLTDATAWALLAASQDSEALGSLGFAGMMLGGPVVHVVHGNWKGAGLSLGARTLLPLGGAALFSAGCETGTDNEFDEGWECIGAILAGGALGYAAALGIDWFVLAKKQEAVPPTGWASMQPSLQIGEQGARAGLAFSF